MKKKAKAPVVPQISVWELLERQAKQTGDFSYAYDEDDYNDTDTDTYDDPEDC